MAAPADSRLMAEDEVERFGYKQELRRQLTFRDLVVYGLIFMVPIAPFGIFGSVYSGAGGMVALAYVVGMIGMAFTALSYSEMARAFPMAGSVYTYAGRGVHPAVGFIAGWQILLDYVLVPALLYVVGAVALHSFVSEVPVWLWVVIFVVVNTVVNSLGIQFTARFNIWMLIAELIVLALFCVIGIGALISGDGQGFSFDPLYNPDTFSIGLVFSAVSIAVLSFLGFDGISTLAEENRDGARRIGRAMIVGLGVAGVLFILQTWIAALLVPDPAGLLKNGDPNGTAFYDAAEVAGGHWLNVLTAVATAIAWGIANALAAQAATSRLLYAMARDRQLPRFLAQINERRRVPVNATLLVAIVSLGVGIWMSERADGITTLSTLVNFGALSAFLLLHVSVVRHYGMGRSGGPVDPWRHLIAPAIGAAIIVYVMIKANVAAKTVGLVWLGVGLVVLASFYATGRRPVLGGLEDSPAPEPAPSEAG
jgi:amino acid transporter